MHSNSIVAYWDGQFAFNKRECEILGWMLMNPKPVTDRQVKGELRYADMNSVRPRITELVKKGCLEECGRVKCLITGKRVRVIRVKARQAEPQMEMFRDFDAECDKQTGVDNHAATREG